MSIDKQKIINQIKNPSVLIVVFNFLLTIVGAVISLILAAKEIVNVLSYIAYIITAVSLTYSVFLIVKNTPTIKENTVNVLKKNKYGKVLIEDYSFRTIISSILSFIITIAFIIFNAIYAVISKNIWYSAIGVYYLILSFTRGQTFLFERKSRHKLKDKKELYEIKKLKNYQTCGISILFCDFLMIGVIVLMLLNQKPSSYTEILAITYAVYSVYKIAMAIFNVIKARKTKDSYIQALRNIALIDAGVALLSLQYALVTTFSDGSDMRVLNLLVGIAIWIISIIIGARMIIYSKKKLHKDYTILTKV